MNRCFFVERAFALALALAVASPIAMILERPALAQEAAYKEHMDNGVKLYADQNYEGALVEFKAAYKARPKASPLTNIALCYKSLFKYPKAIAALEKATTEHGDEMDPADKQAALN